MVQFNIEYSTQNTYEQEVREGLYEFNVIPFEDDFTKIREETIWNSLKKTGFRVENNLGFTTYRIRLEVPVDSFDFSYSCKVNKDKINPFDFDLFTIEQEKELVKENLMDPMNYFYLKHTPSTLLKENKGIRLKREDETTFEFLNSLNDYIHANIKFDAVKSHLSKKPDETLNEGVGVCQDFVNLFMAIAKENKIPVRYVSGYLHQGVGYQGDAQMHAWVEAYLPGVGWKGFDPTNNLLVDHHFIKVCHGFDYAETAPIKGVLATSGKNITNYAVQVSMQQ